MVLKITRDELPMEEGVYGGCLLCPLYPLLVGGYMLNSLSPASTYKFFKLISKNFIKEGVERT